MLPWVGCFTSATIWPLGVVPRTSTRTPRCNSLASTNCCASSPNGSAGWTLPSEGFVRCVAGARTPARRTIVCTCSVGERRNRTMRRSPERTFSTIESMSLPLFCSTNCCGSLSSEDELILPPVSAQRPLESALARASSTASRSSRLAASSESSLRPASSRSFTQPAATACCGRISLFGVTMRPYSRFAPVGILYRTWKRTTLPTSRRRR